MSGLDTHRGAFTEALEHEFEMAPEDARELADVILERFEEKEEVDDETLDAEIRSVFYTLEAKRMVSFRRVEYTREEGEHRRAFYWKLRLESLNRGHDTHAQADEGDVYASLPASAWRHAG